LTALLLVMAVVIMLIVSIVYNSHINTALLQEIDNLSAANAGTARSLSWLDKREDTIEAYIESLPPLGDKNYLKLIIDSEGEIHHASSGALWANIEEKKSLYQAIHASTHGGSLITASMKFVWVRSKIPATDFELVTLHQENDDSLYEFMDAFGLPLIIMVGIMLWIVIWVSLTLGSLFQRLNAQNIQLEEQSVELKLSHEQAVKANHAKSTFLANMSHEIRTPLTAVIGYSEALLGSDQTKEDRLEAINTIHRSSQHVLQIINQILDLSKIEAEKLEVERVMVLPSQLLSEVSTLMRMQAKEKGLSFDVFYKSPVPETVYTDPTRLKQILINLFSNAVKFTEQGYVHINVSCKPEKQLLSFDVLDSGIGMTSEQSSKVFNAFTQADVSTTRQFGGTGLGLTLSKQFAEKLGGDIYIDSEPGRGSRFTVEVSTGALDNVPFVQDFDGADRQEIKPTPSIQEAYYKGSVLLVEDTIENQQLLGMYLRKLGATVSIAGNGQEAVKLAVAHPFDLILMDMQMPIMNGLDATVCLRECGYTRPIVALTANVTGDDHARCTDAGCDGFLTKPIERARFIQVVSSYLHEADNVTDTLPIYSSLLDEEPEFSGLINNYVSMLPGIVATIREAFEDIDWPRLKTLVHQLKGGGGNYGFNGVSDLAAKLEFQVISQNSSEIEVVLRNLESYVLRIKRCPEQGRESENIIPLHDQNNT